MEEVPVPRRRGQQERQRRRRGEAWATWWCEEGEKLERAGEGQRASSGAEKLSRTSL